MELRGSICTSESRELILTGVMLMYGAKSGHTTIRSSPYRIFPTDVSGAMKWSLPQLRFVEDITTFRRDLHRSCLVGAVNCLLKKKNETNERSRRRGGEEDVLSMFRYLKIGTVRIAAVQIMWASGLAFVIHRVMVFSYFYRLHLLCVLLPAFTSCRHH